MSEPGTSPVVSAIKFKKDVMSFADCLLAILDGKKARRLEWEDNGTFITMREGKVMIFKIEDNMLHPLIVTDGDILGDDWSILTEKN